MSDEIEINIRAPGDKKYAVKVSPSATVGELKAKVQEQTEIEADRQRLIYSGRVLKDDDKVENYKIRPGDTVHLVKGASKAAPPPAAAQVPQSVATGNQIAGNPLAPLMNATNPGIGNFNPFAQMGMNTNDPNMYQGMMNSPQAQEQMRQMLSNPAVIDQLIEASPELRNMGPGLRNIMQSEQFRNMMTNPDQMRQMMQQAQQMQQMFGGAGPGGMGGFPGGMGGMFGGLGGNAGGAGAATGGGAAGQTENQARGPTNLFNPQPQPSGAAATGTGAGAGAGQMPDLNALAQMFGQGGMGGMGGGDFGGFGGFGGPGGAGATQTPSQPQDTRPPEERFASQLETLSSMGFVNGQVNIRALLACGGNVQAAVEYILAAQSW
ncbi:hypothetical protein EMMF5_003708 [Cystobasidiomycetes sp. EMM_F5]